MPSLAIQKTRARSLLLKRRGSIDQLIAGRRGLHVDGRAQKQFFRAMQESFAHHFLECEAYQSWCVDSDFFPGDLRQENDLDKIPSLFVSVLKRYRFVTGPEEQIKLTLSSSGTSGEVSAIYLDGKTLKRIRRIVRNIYDDLGMVNQRRTNYLCFTYDPKVASDVGTAFSDELLTGLTKTSRAYYAIRWDSVKEDWNLDTEAVENILDDFEKTGKPLRILGFPAHAYDTIGSIIKKRGKPYQFGPHSYMIAGGGWKSKANEMIPKEQFRQEMASWLGVPKENIRDLYGMVEHGIPYCECEYGNMHVPRFSQVRVVDPLSLETLPSGVEGQLKFLTPYANSYPAISLLTMDKGRLLDSCPCGRQSKVIELHGRGGNRPAYGCAVKALEVLKR